MILKVEKCPNFNHGRVNAPVRFCPLCNEVVNKDIPIKKCTKEEHEIGRRDKKRYCVNCGKRLIQ